MISIIREIREELRTDKAFQIYAACMYRPTLQKYQLLIDEYLSDASIHCFGAFDGERLAGILIVRDTEILGIAVHDEFRRQSFGRSLIFHAAEALKLSLLTAETDDDSVGFYRACGFECTKFERTFPDGVFVRYNCIMKFF